jgi:hypothetical protein
MSTAHSQVIPALIEASVIPIHTFTLGVITPLQLTTVSPSLARYALPPRVRGSTAPV